MSKKHKKNKAVKERRRGFGRFLLVLAALILITLGLRFFFYEPVRIKTNAMEPLYTAGDTVIVRKLTDANRLSRGDLVYAQFTALSGAKFIRRVAGIAGDRITESADGIKVLVPADGSDALVLGEAAKLEYGEIPQGAYLLLSDNTGDSAALDSRQLGLVLESSIVGTPGKVIWPLSRAFK